ncbi:MAG: endonuclease Q family protein [Candidatus Pacearchaeota archaeon]|nr:endonuclease Q family protein [Candidatus Pacearchaeota archaeon]
MQVISDLHIHSRFSRATSHDLNIANLEKWAKIKGIDLLGTGDFCHPGWLEELKKELVEDGSGILKTENGFPFILSNEVSLIYTQDGKGRRVHLVILAPSFEIVEKIKNFLKTKGRIDYDGRPIFNLSCDEFAKAMFDISSEIEIIPAHAWTPWFGIFGSVTGFDSIEEAFRDKAKLIRAFETGMSSDPAMNWCLSQLDKYTIVSFSDSHSYWPWRIGREATVFELPRLTYRNIVEAIRDKKIAFTIETPPSYGKYHYDGHRFCQFSCSPKECEEKYDNTCPICHKPLTIGVLHRVNELADRKEGFIPENAKPFKTLLPLHELIGAVFEVSMTSKKVWQEYNALIKAFGNEFNILLNVPFEELRKVTPPRIVHAIKINREGKIKVKPGYDGEYGELILETEKQETLF